jgi:hypothetical protein
MKENFIREQLLKLFDGKVILVLDEDDLEPLILAAVPALRLEAEELLEESENFGNRLTSNKLRRLANELHALPRLERSQNVFFIGEEWN